MDSRDNDAMNGPSEADGMDALVPTFTANGHVDEGTIHAWLDGAFDDGQAATVEKHVASCAECRTSVAEARGFIAGASRMVRALDAVPGDVVPAADVARAASRIIAAADATRVAHGTARSEDGRAAVALPATRARSVWYTQRRWGAAAAMLVMATGGGYVWQQLGVPRVTSRATAPAQTAADTVAAPALAGPTVSAERPTIEADTPSAAVAASSRRAPIVSPPPRANGAMMADKAVTAEQATSASSSAVALPRASSDLPIAPMSAPTPSIARAPASPQDVAKTAAQAAGQVEGKRESVSAIAGGGFSTAVVAGVVAGVVVDSQNVPVDGANVVVQGTGMRTTTNARGEFVLRLPADSATLQVMRLGFAPSRLAVMARGADTARPRVTLSPSVLSLSALVTASPAASKSRAAGNADAERRRDEAPPSQCWSVQGEPTRVGLRLPVELQVPDIDGVKSYAVRWIGWPDATTQQTVSMRVDNDGRLSGESNSDEQRVRLVLQRIVNGWQGTATHTIAGVRTVQKVQLKRVGDAMCNP